jgi:hypothetical protein
MTPDPMDSFHINLNFPKDINSPYSYAEFSIKKATPTNINFEKI